MPPPVRARRAGKGVGGKGMPAAPERKGGSGSASAEWRRGNPAKIFFLI